MGCARAEVGERHCVDVHGGFVHGRAFPGRQTHF